MAEIRFKTGEIASFDDTDADTVLKYIWRLSKPTLSRTKYVVFGKTKLMHRLILGITDPKIHIDHIDGNGLNNRRANLRIVNRSQNQWNRQHTLKFGLHSVYKGVYRCERSGQWRSQIRHKGKKFCLGRWDNEEHAALIYDIAACLLFGDFCKLNSPLMPQA